MKIYVAGPLSSPSTLGYIRNLATMLTTAIQLHRMGHAVYVPGLDFLFALVGAAIGSAFTLQDMYELNYPWLDACDAVFVIAPSPGVEKELARAKGKPIYTDMEDIPCA